MMRELTDIVRLKLVNGCCPGHDIWPNETYSSRRSIRARSRRIRQEHRYVRRVKKQRLARELRELE